MEGKQDIDLGSFNSKDHNNVVWPIKYIYDYMPTDKSSVPSVVDLSCFPDLKVNSISVESAINAAHMETEYLIKRSERFSTNSIPVFPTHAKLPWHSSIHHVRQNTHWQMAVEATRVLLQHFASDQTTTSILKEGGRSYAEMAAKELPFLHDNWTRFNAYLWPAASEKRLELIAETIVYIFIFDDVWEMNGEKKIQMIQNEFVSRLEAQTSYGDDDSATNLQKAMSSTIQGLHDEDGVIGDGGRDVAARLIDFINHPPPPVAFDNLREFLNYRIIDAAVPYIMACTKFSLCSTVDISSPRIAKFLRLFGDHVSIANDLGSFDKEKKAYVENKVHYLVNTVEEVRKTYSLSNDEDAKFVTLAIQMEVEREMASELSRLNANSEVPELEKEFVNALVFVLSGNVMSSVVMSRYGGKYIGS